MARLIFARARPSFWQRRLRTAVLIVSPILLIVLAGAAGLLLAKRLNQITARATSAAPTAILKTARATDPGERQFLIAEIAKDTCKQAILAQVARPTQAARAGFYQATVFPLPGGGRSGLRVTGEARLPGYDDSGSPHRFSCDIKDGRVIRLALLPLRDVVTPRQPG